ncbi:methylmalonyl-CoA epimerase [Peribacillus kribbensis]|uniref:methylmalonyl-CoA epimerase n=1 Tax=Peribacillus kribbensis TaxID=356658 RepID=UPI0004130F83|nr:methylmalonyl-CoA epimerase [Peribacillus kribbensis]
MIQEINHIGIAVKSIEQSLPFYQDVLGLSFEGTEEVASQKVKVAFLLAGNTRIELLESTAEDSGVARFIEKRGEGIHHIALGVKSIKERIADLTKNGVQMIDKEPREGAHHTQIAFLHPKSCGGVLMELCETESQGER